MPHLSSYWLILITAMLVAASCALIGSFLVLRRMALIGDAISHAILPGFVIALYKVLKISTFDPQLGEALGFSPTLIHYLLMSMVSLTTVACFEAVGALLVVALLIVPAAAAYLLADRLWLVLVLAVGFGL